MAMPALPQAKAQMVAEAFNRRLGPATPASCRVNYIPCSVYEVIDHNYNAGRAWILAEPRMEGRYTKWNNNAGGVKKAETWAVDLDAIIEEDEEERINFTDVPQAFSHFSWSYSDGAYLICDIQGRCS